MASLRAVAICVVVVLGAAACSSDDDAGPAPNRGTTDARSSTTAAEPARPAVDVAGVELRPVPAGKGVAQASDEGASSDYTEVEHLLSGTAHTYSGPATGPVEDAVVRFRT